jgi:hypothetical protein
MKEELDSIWLKAAVAGGLWASFEIIVGSMLHNLHLPFSGTILATLSVMLMTAFMQVWNVQGLVWRAGLICGLMKSLSPSAVILGPMTGIMMEALFIDLVLLITGRHLVGYMLAGAAALLSAILHKLINLFILYGRDLVSIYHNLFIFLQKSLGLEEMSVQELVSGILALYVFAGMGAALLGFLAGKRAGKLEVETSVPCAEKQGMDWGQIDPNQRFRLGLLFLHLFMVPAMLLLVNHYGLGWKSLLPGLLYLSFLLYAYPRIIRRLMKPFFWVQLLLMTLVAGFFWNPEKEAFLNGGLGFLVGLEMCFRAILIVSAFSAFSVEIRNPRVAASLQGPRTAQLHGALALAFSSLPAMLDRSSELKPFLRRPLASFVMLIAEAKDWLICYKTQQMK